MLLELSLDNKSDEKFELSACNFVHGHLNIQTYKHVHPVLN